MGKQGVPPKENQFKPGQSGNPSGRPEGSLSLKTLITKIMEEDDGVDDRGNPKVRALRSIKALLRKAEKGDVSAFKALAERKEGLPKQEVEMSGNFTFADMSKIAAERIKAQAKGDNNGSGKEENNSKKD